MSTSTVSSSYSSGASSTSSTSSDRQTIASNFDTFLTLLTTQLQHQNPLDPLDTNQFTQQLVQFSIAEQEVQQTQSIQDLVGLQKRAAIAGTAQWLGASIEAPIQQLTLSGGKASCAYTIPADLKEATLTVRDRNGAIVLQKSVEASAGTYQFTWDGRDGDGDPVTDGAYTVDIAGKDKSGAAVAITPMARGQVTGVKLDDGAISLMIGDTKIPLDSVRKIARATSETTDTKA